MAVSGRSSSGSRGCCSFRRRRQRSDDGGKPLSSPSSFDRRSLRLRGPGSLL